MKVEGRDGSFKNDRTLRQGLHREADVFILNLNLSRKARICKVGETSRKKYKHIMLHELLPEEQIKIWETTT